MQIAREVDKRTVIDHYDAIISALILTDPKFKNANRQLRNTFCDRIVKVLNHNRGRCGAENEAIERFNKMKEIVDGKS